MQDLTQDVQKRAPAAVARRKSELCGGEDALVDHHRSFFVLLLYLVPHCTHKRAETPVLEALLTTTCRHPQHQPVRKGNSMDPVHKVSNLLVLSQIWKVGRPSRRWLAAPSGAPSRAQLYQHDTVIQATHPNLLQACKEELVRIGRVQHGLETNGKVQVRARAEARGPA